MIKDLVSIIVPVYNVEKFLPDCLLSLENQTYKKTEFIFINDGSTDNSIHLIESFCSKHPNSKLINQTNMGVAISRNIGVKNSSGEFLYFLDSDDMIHPQTIEILVQKINEYNADFISGKNKICSETKKYSDVNWKIINNVKTKTINKNNIVNFISGKRIGTNWSLQVKLYRTAILKQVKNFPEIIPSEFSRGEDLLFNSSYLVFVNKAVVVNCVLHLWRQRHSSLTHIKSFNTKDLKVLESHNPFLTAPNTSQEHINAILGNKAHQAIMLLCVMIKSKYFNLSDVEKVYEVFKENRRFCLSLKHHPWYYIFLPMASIYLKPVVWKAKKINKRN